MAQPLAISLSDLVANVPKVGRKTRKPQHPFHLATSPYVLQPFMIAPVLPGETMTNLLMQARAVTDPIKNPLIGWWKEYYFFYIKLRDLECREVVTRMMLDPDFDITSEAIVGGAIDGYYTFNHSDVGTSQRVNWVHYCLKRVVEEYFREEGEPLAAGPIGGKYYAGINQESFLDSARMADDPVPADDHVMPGQYPTLPDTVPPEFQDHWDQWNAMRALKLTTANFEDFLKSYGVRVPKQDKEDLHMPELIRYVRDWTYPSNTINPANGTPSSACSWAITERADKDRYFSEPGFIFGVTTTRAKVYLQRQFNTMTSHLVDALAWLPAVLEAEPFTSLRKFGGASEHGPGPLADQGFVGPGDGESEYWVDLKDLFMYGEQFTNINPAYPEGFNMVPLPDGNGNGGLGTFNKRFMTSSGIAGLFAGANQLVREDGLVTLSIQSRLRETT